MVTPTLLKNYIIFVITKYTPETAPKKSEFAKPDIPFIIKTKKVTIANNQYILYSSNTLLCGTSFSRSA